MAEREAEGELLGERVLFGTLAPMARLSARLRVPLQRLKHLTELAYYQEALRLGLKMGQIQAVMSVGFSKVGTLSREWKEYGALTGSAVGVQRRVLLLLWGAPLTLRQVAVGFPELSLDQVEAALAEMVAQGQLSVVPGRTERYTVARNHNQLMRDDLLVRLNALQSLFESVAQVVEARFFGRGVEEPAFARTVNFRARRADLEKLDRFYKEALFPLIEELDGAVGAGEADSVPLKLTLLWVRDAAMDEASQESLQSAGDAGSPAGEPEAEGA